MSNGKAETKLKEEIEEKPFPYMSKSTIKSVIKVFPRRIAFISDTHIGSEYALCPKQWTNPKGTTILANPGQLIFLDYFKQFTNRCDELDVDTVFHLGDIMHGQNHKELGADLMTTDLNVQKGMAKEILSPIFKGRKGGFVGGSGYHQGAGKANSPEQDLCEMIKLDGSPEVRWFGPVANVKVEPFDKMWHIQHGESAAIIYQATVLERDQNFMKIAEADGDLPHFDVSLKGHWHTWSHLHLDRVHAVQVPCWASWQPTKWGKLFYGKRPKCGGVICLLDEEGRLTVWPFLYKPVPMIADGLFKI